MVNIPLVVRPWYQVGDGHVKYNLGCPPSPQVGGGYVKYTLGCNSWSQVGMVMLNIS